MSFDPEDPRHALQRNVERLFHNLVYQRPQATHFSERPPSFWINRLLALGFAVDFRFFQAAYNLVIPVVEL